MPDFTDSPDAGLWVLFLLVLADALGIPAPGDSALIVAGGLAAEGTLALPAVIAVAASAAFIGDLVVFEVGRRGGRRLLLRDGRFAPRRRALAARADGYYARYGLATVYIAKFVPGVRAISALTAGTAHMSRRSFAAVDAVACLSWTTVAASLAYAAGPTGSLLLAAAALGVTGLVLAVGSARRRRGAGRVGVEPASTQAERTACPPPPDPLDGPGVPDRAVAPDRTNTPDPPI